MCPWVTLLVVLFVAADYLSILNLEDRSDSLEKIPGRLIEFVFKI